MRKSAKLMLLPVMALFITVSLQAQNYNLKYNYSKGKIYKYKSEFTGDFTQQAMGQEMKMSNGGEMVTKFIVEDVDKEGNMIIIGSLDSGKVTTKNPMKDTTISLNNFADKKTRSFLAPNGKIFKNEAIETVKGGLEAMGISQKQLFNFARLPEKQVKVGDNWNTSDSDTLTMMGGKIVNTSNLIYTLTGKENKQGHDCLKIDYAGDVKNAGSANAMGMEFFIEGSGKTNGTVYIDPKTGVMIAAEGLSNMEMTMATKGEQSMIIPITQSVKMSQSLISE
ncbi:MAG: DUF6263 family protein [Bacillota bacterium]